MCKVNKHSHYSTIRPDNLVARVIFNEHLGDVVSNCN